MASKTFVTSGFSPSGVAVGLRYGYLWIDDDSGCTKSTDEWRLFYNFGGRVYNRAYATSYIYFAFNKKFNNAWSNVSNYTAQVDYDDEYDVNRRQISTPAFTNYLSSPENYQSVKLTIGFNSSASQVESEEVSKAYYLKYTSKLFSVNFENCTGSNYRVTATNGGDWSTLRALSVGDKVFYGETVTCDLSYSTGYSGPSTYTQVLSSGEDMHLHYTATGQAYTVFYEVPEHTTISLTINGVPAISGASFYGGDIMNCTWTTDTGWSCTCNKTFPLVCGSADITLEFTSSQVGNLNCYSSGAWHMAQGFVYLNNAWHLAVPFYYQAGAWHQCG